MAKEKKSPDPESEGVKVRKRGNRHGSKKNKMKPPTKIIIRHLPPTMTEEEFLKQIDPLPEYDSYYFAPADWSLGYDATCRAYITFKNYEDVFLFRDRFDGYVFVDSKGAEYAAIVEFAPFQGLPKNKSRRNDNKVNTIEEESHYQEFLVKLEQDREQAAKGGDIKLEFSLDRKKEEITSTPLLQYLSNKKEKRREEAKKRSEEKKEKRRLAQVDQAMQVSKLLTNQKQPSTQPQQQPSNKEENAGDKTRKDDRKGSRSSRRAERDQRRRQEFLLRKKEEDHKVREQKGKDKVPGSDSVDESTSKMEIDKGDGQPIPENNKQQQNQQQQRQQPQKSHRKEQREKEERGDRNRNRRDRDKNRSNKDKEKTKDGNKTAPKGEEPLANVTDSVKNFMQLCAEGKIVPSTQAEKSSDKQSVEVTGSSKGDSATTNAKDDKPSFERRSSAEEHRRIRNKDRPSIAIYQPKPRVRQSEDSDTNTNKESRSNPTSDCDSVKKEVRNTKKVSRYSQQRSERHSHREKTYSGGESERDKEKAEEKEKENDGEKQTDRGKDPESTACNDY